MDRRPSVACFAQFSRQTFFLPRFASLDGKLGAREPSLCEEARKTAAGSPAKGGTACREVSAVKSRSSSTPSERQRRSTSRSRAYLLDCCPDTMHIIVLFE